MMRRFRNFLKTRKAEKSPSSEVADLAAVSTALQSGQLERALQLINVFIAGKTDSAEAFYKRGNIFLGLGKEVSALEDYDQAVALNPEYAHALCNRGVVLERLDRLQEALQSYDRAVALATDDFLSHFNRASALRKLMRFEESLASYDKALGLRENNAEAYFYRGVVLCELRQFDEAAKSYDRSIELTPSGLSPYAAYSNRGHALMGLALYERALVSFEKSISFQADYAEAHLGRGLAQQQLGRLHDALISYQRAIASKGGYADAYVNEGNTLFELLRHKEAVASYDKAIDLGVIDARLHSYRGLALRQLHRLGESVESFQRAIDLDGRCAQFHVDRANVLLEMGNCEAALSSYERASELTPDNSLALQGRGFALLHMGQEELAIGAIEQSLTVKPDQEYLLGICRHLKMQICDWRDLETDLKKIIDGLEAGKALSTPFPMLSLIDSPSVHRCAARLWSEKMFPQDDGLGLISKRSASNKIHIAYFSPDFRNHPVSLLTAELFETHDRSRFIVTGFAFGPRSTDSVRKRLERGFDRIIDVDDQSDAEVASLARSLGVDVAVDLAGFTEHCRTGIFALRAAPIQVSYLGYLGTMAAPYMDYLLADTTIIPKSEQDYYSEKIIYIPSFQANDSKRKVSDIVYSRANLGLPQDAFVFACFNANYKITPTIFAAWMRILHRVPGSVLFLYAGKPIAEQNIRREANLRGIESHRIVFGEKLPFDEYLARYQSMDLFLDTVPYNAGTTASDALWAGLPVLTCTGRAFATRVAASLLTAVNLPELITGTMAEYEEMAVRLASTPGMIMEIREKLRLNRLATPLFNAVQFAKNLEAAFVQVVGRYDEGLEPDHIYVEEAASDIPVERRHS